ncbi:MAG: hypothetical protein IT171_10360 [Acidobacteria bacterium]|nr:hypothetical protein [Acidobacteriota bacterium]
MSEKSTEMAVTDTNAIKAAIYDRIELIQRAQAEIQHLRNELKKQEMTAERPFDPEAAKEK